MCMPGKEILRYGFLITLWSYDCNASLELYSRDALYFKCSIQNAVRMAFSLLSVLNSNLCLIGNRQHRTLNN